MLIELSYMHAFFINIKSLIDQQEINETMSETILNIVL